METNWQQKRVNVPDTVSLILLLLILACTFYYLYSNRPCAKPITYTIGTFDPQFGISQQTFLADAAEAANLWNVQAGHTVLEYSPTGKMPVNLIYDSRQQLTDTGQQITEQENSFDTEKAALAALQSQYDTQKQQFEQDQASHASAATLNSDISSLNQLAAEIQSSATSLNGQITQVNSQAQSYNSQTGTDFQEGEYIDESGSTRINIYEFMNNTQLVRVLAHEFGHSIGLGHNSDPDSIMYPENTATTISLSTEDKAALAARCTFSLQNLNPFRNPSPSSL
jgi:predicted Zn-dependent protease